VRVGQQVQQSTKLVAASFFNMLREVRAVSLSVFCSEFQSRQFCKKFLWFLFMTSSISAAPPARRPVTMPRGGCRG